jgi:protein gp37
MERTKIEWCDYTWNPVTGCLNNCHYCYAREFSKRFAGDIRLNMQSDCVRKEEGMYVIDKPFLGRNGKHLVTPFGFEPTYHRYRLDTMGDVKNGARVFVGSMADIFGEWVPESVINEIFKACERYPIHKYLFITKNPQRYVEIGVPVNENMWFGTSITRAEEMSRFNYLPATNYKFVSMDPILEDLKPSEHNILFRQVDWIILGAESGRCKNNVKPKKEWIYDIIAHADKTGVPVFMKDSLVPIVGEENMRREFHEGLKNLELSEKMKNRLYDTCILCKKKFRKKEMVMLMYRKKRGEQYKTYAYMCNKCFEDDMARRGNNAV